jgi:hypothetical protein
MEWFKGHYPYTPLEPSNRELHRKDGWRPPGMTDQDVWLTSSTRKYDMTVEGEIRILTLFPGSFEDPICCALSVTRVEDYPAYDAVSYMWGDPTATETISVDGHTSFPVTVNLRRALQYLRRQDKARKLWVDAICINQNSIDERSFQINLMKEIYSRAETVRVWLNHELVPDDPSVQKLLSIQSPEDLDSTMSEPAFWSPLVPLFKNEYWERLWIQQELVLARKLVFHCQDLAIPGTSLMALQHHIVRKAGVRRYPWDAANEWMLLADQIGITKTPSRQLAWWREMWSTKLPVNKYSLQPDYRFPRPELEWAIRGKEWASVLCKHPLYLLGILRYTQHLQVTEPVDRIHAALNLAIDYDNDGTPLDYNVPAAEKYMRVAHLLLFKCNSLQILSQARLPRDPEHAIRGLPSWAPNWNAPIGAGYFWIPFRAASDLPMHKLPLQHDLEDGVLHARGFRYCTTQQILSHGNTSHVSIFAFADKFTSAVQSSTDRQRAAISLFCTLVEPALAEHEMPLDHFDDNEAVLYVAILLCYACITRGLRLCDLMPYTKTDCGQWRHSWRSLETLQEQYSRYLGPFNGRFHLRSLSAKVPATIDQPSRFEQFLWLANHTLASGCLALTSSGELAVCEGAAAVQNDDEVWIVFGCQTPMVLRRNGPHFQIVSPAYIHGIMDGETTEGIEVPNALVFDPYTQGIAAWTMNADTGNLLEPYETGRDRRLVMDITLC